jgi:hypothetical protein
MAARTLRPKHQEDVRLKIQTSQLINRLQNYALSDSEDEISNGRLKAIEVLLRKSLPDLSATELSGDVNLGFHEVLTAARERAGK